MFDVKVYFFVNALNKMGCSVKIHLFSLTSFYRVVGGMDTLNKMEKIECDDKDRPKVNVRN